MKPLLRMIMVLAALVFLSVGEGIAQDQEQVAPDYATWTSVASRAEEAIENDRASEAAMATLRNQLVEWRERFSSESSRRRISVQTLEAQLQGLGAKPEGGDEAADVAEQRNRLEEALAQARAPARQAELARIEAEELIRAVDSLLRNRQANLLLSPGPVPVNPALWSEAIHDVSQTFSLVASEFVTGWVHERQRQQLRQSLPEMLFFLAIGLVLISRGTYWTQKGLARIVHDQMSAGMWILAFVLSFGQVILPMLGVFAMTKAVYATDLPGFRGDVILSVLPLVTYEILIAKWLGERLFSRHETPLLTIHLNEKQRARGRAASFVLGLALGSNTLLGVLARYDNWSPETQAVVFFILTSMAAVVLVRISMLISIHARQVLEVQEGIKSPVAQLILFVTRFMIAASGFAILLGIVGLTRGAAFLAFATTKTVLLIAFLLVAQRLLKKIFAALAGRSDDEDALLAPVIAGTLLVILSTPFLALIWGARVSDLTEFWSRLATGLRVGDTVISPKAIAVFFLVFLIGLGLTRLAQGMMRSTVLPKTKIDPGGQTAVVSGLGYIGIFLAALVAINTAGIDLGNVALFAGALSVGIGFGLQTIVSNFVSGIILLIERPVSEGDWIEVGGQMGYVRDISVRSTRIETFDRTDVIVPNSDLISGTVTNYTRGNTVGRVIVPVGVAYGTDTRLVERILREIAEAHPMVLGNPAPSVVFQGFGADSLDFEIRAILRDVNWMLSVKSDMNHEIARRFVEAGIEIPFAQRDIWIRNPEAIVPGKKSTNPEKPAETAQVSETMRPDMQDFDGGADGEGDNR